MYEDKLNQHLDRAEYIKKTVLNNPAYQQELTPEPKGDNQVGIGTTASAKKEDGDVESEKMVKKLIELNSENKQLKDENKTQSEEIERLRDENTQLKKMLSKT